MMRLVLLTCFILSVIAQSQIISEYIESTSKAKSICSTLSITGCLLYCDCALCSKDNNETSCISKYDHEGNESALYAFCLLDHHIREPDKNCSWYRTPYEWFILIAGVIVFLLYLFIEILRGCDNNRW